MTEPSRATLIHTVYVSSYGGGNGWGLSHVIRSRDEGATAAIVDGKATLACTEACGLTYDFHLTTPEERRRERLANVKRRALYFVASYPFVGVTGIIASNSEGVVSILAVIASGCFSLLSLAQVVMLFKKPATYRLSRRGSKPVALSTPGESINHTAKLY